jgi:hypothetical protein
MLKTLVIKLGSSSSRENYQGYYNIIEQNIFKFYLDKIIKK